MSLAKALDTLLPDGWTFTHIIRLGDNDWQVIAKDDTHVTTTSGETIEDAFDRVAEKIYTGKYVGIQWLSAKLDEDKPVTKGITLRSLGLGQVTYTFRKPQI